MSSIIQSVIPVKIVPKSSTVTPDESGIEFDNPLKKPWSIKYGLFIDVAIV